MIRQLIAKFTASSASAGGADPVSEIDTSAALKLRERMHVLDNDPYLSIADERLGIVTVFDDLRYDRADADMMSPGMRRHAMAKLKSLGFDQISGNVLREADTGLRVHIPKFHALGASPFDITRYTPKHKLDFYLLTPTQTACRWIDTLGKDDAVKLIKALIAKHPINIYRLMDYLERSDAHQEFLSAIGHLKYVQREAVESEPLKRRRALG